LIFVEKPIGRNDKIIESLCTVPKKKKSTTIVFFIPNPRGQHVPLDDKCSISTKANGQEKFP